jgi:hypothetical protein
MRAGDDRRTLGFPYSSKQNYDAQTASTPQGTARDFEPIRPGEQGIILRLQRAFYTGNPQFFHKGQHVTANSHFVWRLRVAVGPHCLGSAVRAAQSPAD